MWQEANCPGHGELLESRRVPDPLSPLRGHTQCRIVHFANRPYRVDRRGFALETNLYGDAGSSDVAFRWQYESVILSQ